MAIESPNMYDAAFCRFACVLLKNAVVETPSSVNYFHPSIYLATMSDCRLLQKLCNKQRHFIKRQETLNGYAGCRN